MEENSWELWSSEIYDALIDAGADEVKARAAAEAVPISDQLATKQDVGDFRGEIGKVRAEVASDKADLKVPTAALEAKISGVEVKMWRMAVAVASLVVLLNRFLDWVIK